MTAAAPTLPVGVKRPPPSIGARLWARTRRYALTIVAGLAFAYLLLPIAVVVLFSFNDPAGRRNLTWQGFTFDHWLP